MRCALLAQCREPLVLGLGKAAVGPVGDTPARVAIGAGMRRCPGRVVDDDDELHLLFHRLQEDREFCLGREERDNHGPDPLRSLAGCDRSLREKVCVGHGIETIMIGASDEPTSFRRVQTG